jgi:mannobiose 2-epimerase
MTDPLSNHLVLFFDEQWNAKSSLVSFGHEIESVWLVQEASETITDAALTAEVEMWSVKIANAAAEGLDADGGLWYEKAEGSMIKEKHWWPQAEAMVGFYHAYELTGEARFLEYSLRTWEFIKQHIIDQNNGEWHWGVKNDYTIMEEDKIGMWKCPYHNARACMEIIKRIRKRDNHLHS